MDSAFFYNTELEEELGTVKNIIIENIKSPYPDISDPLLSLVKARSKMLRPAFLLLSSRFGKPEKPSIYLMAAAVEMLHTATLIHDDIIDGAATRRGQKTLHSLYGARQSVLMGDYLLTRGYRLIFDRLGKENQLSLSAVISHLCESEIMESASAFKSSITEREYLRRIAGKTASLFAISCHTGASESGCDPETVSALRRCGYCAGMAFQIIDDLLDFKSSEHVLGKPSGNDLREGTYTLPVIYAAENGGEKYRHMIESLGKKKLFPVKSRIQSVISMTENLGGTERAEKKAGLYTERALREIGKLPPGTARDEISSLLGKMLSRKY